MRDMDGGPLDPLERYLAATTVSPRPDLVERIGARLLLEPPSSAPRRFLGALRARDVRGIVRGLGQNATTAFRPGTRSALLRAQAMAIVLVTTATVAFGSVAGLAATQYVTEQVVEELSEWSARGSAAPAAPTAPSVGQRELYPADSGPDPADSGPAEPGSADVSGSAGAPGQACGLPEYSEADHLQGTEADGCPDVPDTGQPSDKKERPENPGKADPPAAKPPAKSKADPPAAKPPVKSKAQPPSAKKSERDASTPSSERKSRASDSGMAPSRSKERRQGDRD